MVEVKKLFVQYPNFRSSTRRFDPCVMEGRRVGECRKCKVFVTSDRFLGEKRHVRLVGSLKKFPYVIIMDTAGCNLRCWFCYAYHFWKPDVHCEPVFLSADDLINQLKCKIGWMQRAESKMDKKPFTSIRVSGGEPIYADPKTLMPYQSEKKIDYMLGIDFWLDFFEKLNDLVEELRKEGKINLVSEADWDYSKSFPWPTFVSDARERLYVRFDTNGIAFGDNEEAKRVLGGAETAERFIKGLFSLYKKGKLNHIKVWVTYSLKGACPNEYFWSQSRKLPTTEDNEDYDFIIDEHPQYSGLRNLKIVIDRCITEDSSFKDCVGLTVERGINHDLEHKVYLYNLQALRWEVFEKKSGIELSEVKNDICLVYTYGGGPWSLRKVTPGLIKRYFNQGAELIIESDFGKRFFKGSYDDALKATRYIADHFLDNNFRIIIRPRHRAEKI